MSADHVTLERGLWWRTVGTPGRTFVLADLLNPGQRVHLHQCIWDADHVHHVHDALKARTHAEVTQERPPPRAGSTRDTTGCARHAPGRSAPCRWAAGPSASQNNPEASSGRYPSPLASCSQPPLMNGAHSRSEQRPGGGRGRRTYRQDSMPEPNVLLEIQHVHNRFSCESEKGEVFTYERGTERKAKKIRCHVES